MRNYLIGGGGEIRTHGHLRVAGFQDRCLKPLGNPSVEEVCFLAYFGAEAQAPIW